MDIIRVTTEGEGKDETVESSEDKEHSLRLPFTIPDPLSTPALSIQTHDLLPPATRQRPQTLSAMLDPIVDFLRDHLQAKHVVNEENLLFNYPQDTVLEVKASREQMNAFAYVAAHSKVLGLFPEFDLGDMTQLFGGQWMLAINHTYTYSVVTSLLEWLYTSTNVNSVRHCYICCQEDLVDVYDTACRNGFLGLKYCLEKKPLDSFVARTKKLVQVWHGQLRHGFELNAVEKFDLSAIVFRSAAGRIPVLHSGLHILGCTPILVEDTAPTDIGTTEEGLMDNVYHLWLPNSEKARGCYNFIMYAQETSLNKAIDLEILSTRRWVSWIYHRRERVKVDLTLDRDDMEFLEAKAGEYHINVKKASNASQIARSGSELIVVKMQGTIESMVEAMRGGLSMLVAHESKGVSLRLKDLSFRHFESLFAACSTLQYDLHTNTAHLEALSLETALNVLEFLRDGTTADQQFGETRNLVEVTRWEPHSY